MSSSDARWEPASGRFVALAVTGGIACGKSEAGRIMGAHGVAVCDTDELAREVVRPGSETLRQVVGHFGADVLGPDGALNRAVLAERVFGDERERHVLNGLLHPPIRRLWTGWLAGRRREQVWAAVQIPLLFEVDETRGWDAIICVSAPEERVLERLRARGLSGQEARARIAAQWPVKKKEEQSDFVIENDGSLSTLEQRTVGVLQAIQKEIEHHG